MRRIPVLLSLTLFAALIAGAPAAAAKSCLGKKATITSNANSIRGTKAPDVIVAGPGNNNINGEGGNDRICGGGGNDDITGDRGSDRVSGDGGNDTVLGDRGKDKLFGGAGNDRLSGDRGSDEADGGGGRDRVFGDTGNDSLTGGDGARDYVDGGLGDEPRISGGGGGYDVVVGNSGVDQVDGGGGPHDIANYATSSQAIYVDLGAGRMTGAETERLTAIEDVIGGAGNDTLSGNAASNRLDGGPGDDNLRTSGGGDAAFGGPGSDSCSGVFDIENSCGTAFRSARIVGVELISSIDGASYLVIDGTEGDDAINVSDTGGGFRISSNGQTLVAPGDPQAPNCQRIRGTGDVECRGSAARLQASMRAGNDKLDASGLTRGTLTTIDGGVGSDEIRGSNGSNTIYAGADRAPDSITGGGRSDILFGINTEHPRKDSGAAVMRGLGGDDLLVGGQPCDGDTFSGGSGDNDSASFARVRNSGVVVDAEIGGKVTDPNVGNCNAGRILGSVEKIEGSPGADRLTGDGSGNDILGRGGNDKIHGKGGNDRCIGGGGSDSGRSCEGSFSMG